MFEETKQNNNQNQSQEPVMPTAPKEDLSQRIARLNKQGKSRISRKTIILAVALFILIAGGAGACYMYWDKVSGFLGIENVNNLLNNCDYDNPDKKYIGKSTEECAVIKFVCEGKKYFADDCGCGCDVVEEEQIFCAQDAKQCLDGSFVSRVAPNCEFTECPGIKEEGFLKYSTKEECQADTNDQCFYFDCNNPLISKTDTLFPLICEEPYNPDKFWISQMKASETCHKWCAEKYGEPTPQDLPPDPLMGITIGDDCLIGCAIPQDAFKEQGDNQGISNWQTYRNEEQEVSFKYPVEYGNVLLRSFKKEDFMERGDGIELSMTNNKYFYIFLYFDDTSNIGTDGYTYERIRRDCGNIKDCKQSFLPDSTTVFVKSSFTVFECSPIFKVIAYLKNKKYKNIEVAIILKDAENQINRTHTCENEEKEEAAAEKINQIISGVMTGENISDNDKLTMGDFNQIISTFRFLTDTDSDGLYDDEEAKYGTDINNPDSDGDEYLDGSEVDNGYNPMGEGMLENF